MKLSLRTQGLLFLILSLSLVAVAVRATGLSPFVAVREIIHGSLYPVSWEGTIKQTVPLILTSYAVYLALRTGLFNIGAEGQFAIGALCCAAVALKVPGGGLPAMAAGCLAGFIDGALWAFPAGYLKAYRGGHEVITTLMMNAIAAQFGNFLAAGVLKDPDPNTQSATTAIVPKTAWLPDLISSPTLTVSSALIVGVLAAVVVTVFLSKSIPGYEFKAVGSAPRAALFAGVDTKKVTVRAMAVSGALAGLAGAIFVLGYEHRYYPSISSGYGFDALGVAMLAGLYPILVLPNSFLFGAIKEGCQYIQTGGPFNADHGVPIGVSNIILGILVVSSAVLQRRGDQSQ